MSLAVFGPELFVPAAVAVAVPVAGLAGLAPVAGLDPPPPVAVPVAVEALLVVEPTAVVSAGPVGVAAPGLVGWPATGELLSVGGDLAGLHEGGVGQARAAPGERRSDDEDGPSEPATVSHVVDAPPSGLTRRTRHTEGFAPGMPDPCWFDVASGWARADTAHRRPGEGVGVGVAGIPVSRGARPRGSKEAGQAAFGCRVRQPSAARWAALPPRPTGTAPRPAARAPSGG